MSGAERLVYEFTENYMEKLFYFCLKKTGNSIEAEDLTQDIALNIIAALNKGTTPNNFSAWIWQIARNRYSVWADEKHRRNESLTGYDIDDYEIKDDSNTSIDELIYSEQLSLLRRELAFVSSDYRDIVIAYYIDNKSVRDIAENLLLTTDAVKKRLQRARNILKEGMNMAREFGVRSYKPENVDFMSSGLQPSGLPWSAVQRSIPKNILLQASNNPSTVEELSIELGIALPYMKEEIELLYNATLLEKYGDKYITNFFILDKKCRLNIYNVLRESSNERSRLIQEFIEDELTEICKTGIAHEQIDDNDIKWWLLLNTVDYCISNLYEKNEDVEPAIRANGESWGFVGFEQADLPEATFVGHNGCGNDNNMFWAYIINEYDLFDQCGEMQYECVMLLSDCIRNKRNISSFTKRERELWSNINGKYAHADENGFVVPDILVFEGDSMDKVNNILKGHKNYEPIMNNIIDVRNKIEQIFIEYSHKVLHKNMGYYICSQMYFMRMLAIRDLVENGFLKLPDDTRKSTLGMHMILK